MLLPSRCTTFSSLLRSSFPPSVATTSIAPLPPSLGGSAMKSGQTISLKVISTGLAATSMRYCTPSAVRRIPQASASVAALERLGARPTPIPTTDVNDSQKRPHTSSARWLRVGQGATHGPFLWGVRNHRGRPPATPLPGSHSLAFSWQPRQHSAPYSGSSLLQNHRAASVSPRNLSSAT